MQKGHKLFLSIFIFSFGVFVFKTETASFSRENNAVVFSGEIYDSQTARPLPGATVFIPELNRGDVADKNGEFRFEVMARGNYTVVCKFIGYSDLHETLQFFEDTHHNFYLKPTVIEFPGVTITAEQDELDLTKSSQSVSVLTGEKLEKHRGQTLGESLKEVPGVTVLQTGPSISKPVVRGLHSQRVLVLNGGIPQEGQQWGAEHAPEIDPFSPHRIEVVKGAAGVEYGSSAMGGVVRIEPRDLAEITGLGGQVSINAFSNNGQGAGSLLLEGHAPFTKSIGWRMRGSIRKAGDSRAPDYVITNSGFEEQDWAVATGYLKERFGIEVNYSHFGTELGIFGGSHIGNLSDLERAIERGQPVVKNDFTYDIGFPKQTVSHDLLSLKTSYKFARAGRLEMQYGWQENRRKEYDAHAPFSSQPPSRAAFDLKLITHTGEVRFQHHPVKSIFGKIGVSGMRQTNVRKTTGFLIPNFRADTIGAYFVENWSTGRLTVSTGTRLSYRWQKVFEAGSRNIPERVHEWSNVSGVAGLIYQFAGDWSIATNIGTAWRPPGVNELYSNGVHHGTAQMEIGDPDLTTEKSFNVDATLRNIGGRSHLEFSVYRNRIDDFMLLFPEPEPTLTIRGAFPTFSYRQTDALLRGFDLTFDYRLTGLYRFGLRGSLVRGDDLGADEPLIYMPSDRLTWLNGFDLPSACLLHDLSFELSTLLVRRQTRFPEGADYADPPPGYTLFDLDLRGKLDFGRSHVSLNLSVKNLFNVAYRDYLSRFRYFIDEPGRTILFKTQIPIGHFSL